MYWGPKKVDIEKCMLRGMRLVTRKDRIRNEHIRFTNELTNKKRKIKEHHLKWFGTYIEDENQLLQDVLIVTCARNYENGGIGKT